jgi:hypothetical protein
MRIAYESHGPCVICNKEINPSDEYEADVVVCGRKLQVRKYHVFCPHDWHEDEDDERERDFDEKLEKEERESQSEAA